MIKNIIKSLSTIAICGSLAVSSQTLLAGDTIKIGSFLAVTGGASFLGDPELKTLKMYTRLLYLVVALCPIVLSQTVYSRSLI